MILDDIGIYDYDYEHACSTLFNVFIVLLETLFVKPSTLLVRILPVFPCVFTCLHMSSQES